MKICLKNEDDTSVSTHYLQHDQIQKHPHIFATTNEIWKAAFLKKYKKILGIEYLVAVVWIPGCSRNPQNLQQRPHPLMRGQQRQQKRHLQRLLPYPICVKEKRREQGVVYLSMECIKALRRENKTTSVGISSFSSLNKPSRTLLASLYMQQLHRHCSLAPPALAPVNESCTFTSGATFQLLD